MKTTINRGLFILSIVSVQTICIGTILLLSNKNRQLSEKVHLQTINDNFSSNDSEELSELLFWNIISSGERLYKDFPALTDQQIVSTLSVEIKDFPTLVLRINENYCTPCVNQQVKLLQSFEERRHLSKILNVIIIATYTSIQDVNIFKYENRIWHDCF